MALACGDGSRSQCHNQSSKKHKDHFRPLNRYEELS
jgi:hypothetical protein